MTCPQYNNPPSYHRPMPPEGTYLVNTPKKISTAYALLALLGIFGGHRFYLRHTGMGVLYLLTMGVFGFGPFVDFFVLSSMVDEENRRIATERRPVHTMRNW